MATTRNKVMWQEGMLMRPHHFQQQQRYNDYLDNQRFRAMNDLSWGFTELTLNNELLAQGKIMIDSASGTLPDGTVFSIPDQDALPDPLHPQHFPDERSRNIYLALPVASDVRNEISDGRRIGRYRLNYADVRDLHSEEGDARTLTLGQLTPRIMSGAEDMSAYITLPLCRISDRHADGSLTLDDDFIPSCQNIQVSKKLRVYLKEVLGAIGGRASDLANRIGSPAQSGIADVAEFMMLQLLNRNQTRFTHRARRSQLHPEDFYLDLAGLLGELMTFTELSRLPCPLDVYDHHDLTKTFKTLLLNLTRSVKYSDADRAEIQRQLTEQYISDYTATWRAGMDNLNIRNFESIGQLTGALEQVISGDQPLQRALTVLRDNTQPGVFSEKLSAKEREEALAEPDYQLLTRLGHEFAPENSTLAVQKDKESTMQAVYQQLTELHRYLLAIQNAPVPGKSALKAVQLRLDQNSSDPIFATRQMAKTLPAPLNRWVGRLADQAWHVVMVEAVHYMEVDWRDSVVKPFNEQLANNYPFNPRSAQDASLDAFERFFKPDGILDTFYQQNLKLFIDNDLSLEDGDNNVIIREDIIAQLETAQKIRDIFFSKQNGLGTSFAVETVSLSGNKRRSVLNLDGQLVDYSQGRNYTAHLVWPNNMREGNESKLTLIGTSGNAPRSISFSGPWAQFRLFGAGQLTGVQDGNFTVRFIVDGGAMTYRVHTDTEDNPFSGGLFSQFGLSDTLY
ncbi:type VI secretion system baseplate subunit TssK [Escherichia coli]|uniref:type VI secretion system baseplate subunit TssK n=9 Tax=Escherichia coli TaxID=562 RepID=UPI00102D8B27|nr:type VI secretion system baseplate subunit TssK [Escherichia coli]RZZ91404.1 type VI secretion system baseplate subunit TssK [Escherichia coli]